MRSGNLHRHEDKRKRDGIKGERKRRKQKKGIKRNIKDKRKRDKIGLK